MLPAHLETPAKGELIVCSTVRVVVGLAVEGAMGATAIRGLEEEMAVMAAFSF